MKKQKGAEEAMIQDIPQAKAMGFNMLRKHIKIEPLRWYYHCDRLGMLVWQDFAMACASYSAMPDFVEQIEKEAAKRELDIDILLEVNVAGEESKFGFAPEEVEEAIRAISVLPHVHIKGLMTIAPFVENSEENRDVFKKLYQLNVDMKSKNIDNVNMTVLSMGMTGDYEVAIEEGAGMIRVGTGIFGVR